MRLKLVNWGQKLPLQVLPHPQLQTDPLLGKKYIFKRSNPNADLNENVVRIQIFAPELRGSFHTITALALYQKRFLSKTYPVVTLLGQSSPTKFRRQFDVLLQEEIVVNSYGISIYHVGNNPASVTILKHFLLNETNKKIVYLHDLNLLDLAYAYCVSTNLDHTLFEYLQNKLGVYGSIAIHKKMNEIELTKRETITLAGIILEDILDHADLVISHQNVKSYLDLSHPQFEEKSHVLNLPLGYFLETETQPEVYRLKNKIVISGHASGSKQLDKILSAINYSMSYNSDVTCLVVGSMCQSVKELQREVTESKFAMKFDFIPNADDKEWEELHRSCAVGVRLGVGANGESSGLVRDYLYFGLNVITDETSEIMRTQDRVTIVDPQIDALELGKLILEILETGEKEDILATELTQNNNYQLKMEELLEGLSNG